MIINLTEKEIKTIDYCLQSKMIDVKGLAAIGACDRAVVEQMEGLIRKLETRFKLNTFRWAVNASLSCFL